MARRLEDAESLVAAQLILGQALPDVNQAMNSFAEAQAILEQTGDPQKPWILAYLHYLVGDRLRENGRYAEAADRYRQSLALYRQMGNVDSIAYPMGNLGRLAFQQGHLEEAHRLMSESLALSRAIGNRQGLADWLIPLGLVTLYLGNASDAEVHLQEAFLFHEEVGNRRGLAEVLTYQALVALAQNEIISATQYSRDSLAVYGENWQHSQAVDLAQPKAPDHIVPDLIDAFFVATLVNVAHGQFGHAATILAIASKLQQQIEHQPNSFLQQQIETAMTAVHQNLSPAEYEKATAVVQKWSFNDMFEFTLSTG
jgi:tetratricopeptide (TPR) repeat protein